MSSRYAVVERGREGGGFQSRSGRVAISEYVCTVVSNVATVEPHVSSNGS